MGFSSPLYADWDYKYLKLEELIKKSELIIVAEIKSIEENMIEGKVTQNLVLIPTITLKGKPDPKGIKYHASYIPKLCKMPLSYYIDSPPGTKFLLFLNEKDESYISVLGPCGALKVNDYLKESVFWYTDSSKAQRYADHWKKKSLEEVIDQIKKMQNKMLLVNGEIGQCAEEVGFD